MEKAIATTQLRQQVTTLAQQQQTESQFLRTVIDTVPNHIFVKDGDGRYLLVNQKLADFYGATIEQLLHKQPGDFYREPDRIKQYIQENRQVIATQQSLFIAEEADQNSQGDDCWFQWHKVPIQLPGYPESVVLGVGTDITQRKQAELALVDSENRFRATFEQAAIGICHVSLDGHLLWFNSRLCEMSGYSPDQLQQITFQEITHPDDLPVSLHWMQQLLRGHRLPYTLEKRYIRKDRSILWANLTVSLVRDPQGQPAYFIGMIENISERKQAELALQQLNHELEQRVRQRTEELQHSNQQLQQALTEQQKLVALVENSQDFIAIATPSGQMSYLNQAGRRLVGLEDTTDVSQYQILDFHFPDDWPTLERTVVKTVLAGAAWEGEVRLRHFQTQAAIPMMHGAFPIFQAQTGELLAIAGILRNIAAQKQTEIALKQSKRRYATLTAAAPVAILQFDTPFHCIYANDRWSEMTGRSRSEALGRGWLNALHPDDRTYQIAKWADLYAQSTTEKLITNYGEGRHLTPQGSIHWFYLQVVPELDTDGNLVGYIGTMTDITERKQVEDALYESQQFLQTVLDTFPQSVFWKDRNSCYLGCNQNFLRDVGFRSIADLVGKSDDDLPWAKSNAAFYQADDRQVMNTGEAKLGIIETQINATGQQVWLETNKLPLHNWMGEIIGILGTYQDITARKQAEIDLERSRQLREAIFNQSTDALFLVDPATDLIIDCNEQAVTMFEATQKAELVQMQCTALQRVAPNPEELATILEDLEVTGFWSRELEFITRLDRIFWANIAGTMVTGAEQPLELVRLSDITDRKTIDLLVHQQLEKEQLLVSVLTRIRDALELHTMLQIVADEVRDLIHSDRVLVYQLHPDGSGSVVAEAITEPWRPLLHQSFTAEVFPQTCYDHYIQGGISSISDQSRSSSSPCLVTFMQELQIRAKLVVPIVQQENQKLWGLLIAHECSGPRQWQAWEMGLFQQMAGQLAIAIQQADLYYRLQAELTERQQAEAVLQATNEQLQNANMELARATRLKDEFLANMSHELRTPLNAILGMAETLQDEVFGPLNHQQQRAAKTIEQSGKHLLDLINDILDLAKIEAGKLELSLTPYSIQALCSSSVNLVKQMAHQKQIRLSLVVTPNLEDIELDDRRMRQVLVNLLSNAIKFTPEGGTVTLEAWSQPMPAPSIDSSPCNDSPHVQQMHFSVVDTGIGIAPENLSKLFQSFVQIDSALNRQYNGTGLGLALVKRITELHGGQIQVQSQPDQGSRFTVILPYQSRANPLQPPLDSLPPGQSPQPLVAHTPFQAPPLILLAEDNPAHTETYSNYLVNYGYRLVVASNGLETVELATRYQPDLILMDMQMPHIDGLSTVQQIRAVPGLHQIPILALATLGMPGDRDKCLAAGITDCLAKPIRLRHLVNQISALLTARKDPCP